MSDNLANNWGCNLVIPEESRGHKRHKAYFDNRPDTADFKHFQLCVNIELGGRFTLTKVLPNGSDANSHAVDAASNGNNSHCLYACGSYIAGDSSIKHQSF